MKNCIEIFEDEDDEFEFEDTTEKQSVVVPWQLRAILIFLLTWQFSYGISDAGVLAMLLFMYNLFRMISLQCEGRIVELITNLFPKTFKSAFQLLGINITAFTEFIVCPKCSAVFNYISGYTTEAGRKTPNTCPYIKMPNHPHISQRRPCGAYLMKSGKARNGSTILRPFKVFACQSLKTAMKNLINRTGFLDQCEHWRARYDSVPENLLGDIYDARVWREFMNVQGVDFLNTKYSFCFAINVDWFQPFTRTRKLHTC